MKNYLLLVLLSLVFVNCSTSNVASTDSTSSSASTAPQVAADLKSDAVPLKGQFLDYIHQIEPKHKDPYFVILTKQLHQGYAYGGPDNIAPMSEWFLFRGKTKDLVLKQIQSNSEPNVTFGPIQKYAPQHLEAYSFKNNVLKKEDIKSILHFSKVDALYNKQLDIMRKDMITYKGWDFFRYIHVPIEGTTISLKVCRQTIELVKDNPCVLIGTLNWNKTTFQLREDNFTPSSEKGI